MKLETARKLNAAGYGGPVGRRSFDSKTGEEIFDVADFFDVAKPLMADRNKRYIPTYAVEGLLDALEGELDRLERIRPLGGEPYWGCYSIFVGEKREFATSNDPADALADLWIKTRL